jgi:antitoxin (DNA-binding transcriptional repressor) of toxin-antitoxin stability system
LIVTVKIAVWSASLITALLIAPVTPNTAPGVLLTMVVDHDTIEGVETVNISTFKATCLARLDKVKRTGRPLLVTRKGEPIAEIRPPSPSKRRAPWLGSLSGTGHILGDIVAPAASATDWEVLR